MRLTSFKRAAAFTMVEIALCLAIVGFALVAIIGVLPTGMNVQKDNRQQTIINQDAAVWFDLIRNGSRGYDDLTNYVTAITNYWTIYRIPANTTNIVFDRSDYNGYTYSGSRVTLPNSFSGIFALTNGARIVGLLSTPKYWVPDGPYRRSETDTFFSSNYVVAYVRAMSGAAAEKAPQKHPDVLDAAFAYRMIVESAPYVPLEMSSTDASSVAQRHLQWNNSSDLRLLFRWPVLPNGIGNGRQTFRMMTTGQIVATNDPTQIAFDRLFYFQPTTFVQAQ